MSNIFGESNLIVWQKWFDPFGGDDMPTDNEDQLEEENIDEAHSDKEDISLPIKSNPIKAIATPMGLIPYTENTASGKIFNFWTGHTNFNLSKKIVDIIENSDGVEVLDVFTRYRFRIAIGKIFDDSKVMRNINNQIYAYLDDGKY